MKKKTKLLVISSLFAVTGIGVTVAAAGGFNDALGGVLPAKAGQHDSTHTLKEKAYEAPTYTKEGFKPYYLCEECCEYGPEEARYSYEDKTTHATLSDIRMEPLTEASVNDVAEGDMISTINTQKFKYVDQGANGVDGKEGESTPMYVKDGDKTALFFSRSGKTGEGTQTGSEFRFSPTSLPNITSVTFSYRYLDYGTTNWAGGGSDGSSEPGGTWRNLVQFYDEDGGVKYYGKAVTFINDDQWHTITINYKDILNRPEITQDFKHLVVKVIDLRGHFYISNLSFAEAPVTVTLKNATADGTDLTESVAKGSMPTTIPTMEGKTFAGWYDEEGNKVEAISGATTLIARWTVNHYNSSNDKLLKFENDASKYGKPADCDFQWSTRGSDRNGDIENGYYLDEEGSQGFLSQAKKDDDKAGIILPAYDFSNSPAIRFNFGFSAGLWNGVEINGVECGRDAADQPFGTKWKNFTVIVDGRTMIVHNAFERSTPHGSQASDISIELTDDVYYGRKGIEIAATRAQGVWLMLFPFVTMQCDYVKTCQTIEAELPDIVSDEYKEKLEEYETLRQNFSNFENSTYPISEKMQNWIDALLPKTVLSFEDNGQSVIQTAIGNTGQLTCNESAIKEIKEGSSFNTTFDPFDLDEESMIVRVGDLLKSYVTFTLPQVNFSTYKEVTFTFGFGANVGTAGKSGSWALGTVPTNTTDLTTVENYIGTSIQTSNKKWTSATDFKAVISDGKISFSNSGGTTDKTFDLENDVFTGEKGLTLTFGNVNWEIMVLSPLMGFIK